MRLTPPLPHRTHPLPQAVPLTNPSDFFHQIPPWDAEGAPCGVSNLSVIPSSFGSIYASETFRSFLSVFNQSPHPIHSISLSIHIQTPSQQSITLLDTTQTPREKLDTKAGINKIVKSPLPELGVHKLFCAVTYRPLLNPSSPARILRQTFRFNVLPPLEPSLTVRPLYHALESFPLSISPPRSTLNYVHYLVDLRVLNAVPVPVYATDATFVPRPPFRVRPLIRDAAQTTTLLEDALDAGIVEGRAASMGVGDARNFIFHVYRPRTKPQSPVSSSALEPNRLASSASERPSTTALRRTDRVGTRSMRPIAAISSGGLAAIGEQNRRRRHSNEGYDYQSGPAVLGHMTVSWRSALGEVGHLDNVVTAEEPIVLTSDVEVCIYAVPEKIYTHRPFVARCAARNNMRRAVRLYLQVRRDLVGEIVPVGVSGVSLGEVRPGCTVRCSITLIPLVRGQHSISGVRVVDIDSNMSYKADPPVLSVV